MNLDDVLPEPRYRTCFFRVVRAPPHAVWDELHRITMSDLPLGRALEGLRVLPARVAGRNVQPLARRRFLDVTPIPVLFSDRPHVVVAAGLSQAWRLLGGPAPPRLDAAAVRAWTAPGWIKVAMEYRMEAVSRGTLLSIETRIAAADTTTARRFAAYWLLVRGASGAIRRELLRTLAHLAETADTTA
jgi:hypothetical protein